MPKVKANPNAKAPEFIVVAPGEYRMKFTRLAEGACKQSEAGNWYTKMRLEHVGPFDGFIDMNNAPLKPLSVPGSVFVTFMMDPEMQGTLRQAVESTGQAWPAQELEIDENWIQDVLENRECVARLKTSQYQGNWKNEVARFIVPAVA